MTLNLSAQTLRDIESLDPAAHGFDRSECKNVPADIGASYKPVNVHVFLSSSLRAPQWDSQTKNVKSYTEVNAALSALKAKADPALVSKSATPAEAFRLTVFHNSNSAELFSGASASAASSSAASSATSAAAGVDEQLLVVHKAATSSSSSSEISAVAQPQLRLATVSAKAFAQSETPWLQPELCKEVPSTSRFVFICSHVQRDARCGFCGAALVDLLEQELKRQRDALVAAAGETTSATAATAAKVAAIPTVYVSPCAHVGGHTMAGNVLALASDGGFCFGCANPSDVPALATALLQRGSLTDSLLSFQSLQKKIRGALIAGVKNAVLLK